MTIYKLRADSDLYQNIYPIDRKDWRVFNKEFNGSTLSEKWFPVKTIIQKNGFQGEQLLPSDFPSLATHIPVFSKKAVKALSDILRGNGELLQFDNDSEEYYAFNVTHVIDALDEPNSVIKYFEDGGIMDVVKYSLIFERVENMNIFKLSKIPLMDVFVSCNFVDRVNSCKLSGFDFIPIC